VTNKEIMQLAWKIYNESGTYTFHEALNTAWQIANGIDIEKTWYDEEEKCYTYVKSGIPVAGLTIDEFLSHK